MLLGGLFDALDGAVARESNSLSSFGAFLDSTLDRLSESAIFVGLIFFYASMARPYGALLAGAAMTFRSSPLRRARAEGLNIDCEVGFLERAGRIVILSVFSIFGPLTVGLSRRGWRPRNHGPAHPTRPPCDPRVGWPAKPRRGRRLQAEDGVRGLPPPQPLLRKRRTSRSVRRSHLRDRARARVAFRPRTLQALKLSLQAVGLHQAYVTCESTGLLAQEIQAAEPHVLVAIGAGAANDIDAIDYPLVRQPFSTAKLGVWFPWTKGTKGLRTPALAPALDDEAAKRRFWLAFLTLKTSSQLLNGP